MTELSQGTTITALAGLEQQILQRFQAQTFDDLQLGASSFLQLLQRQPYLLELLVGCSQTCPSDVGAAVSLSSVLEVVSQAQASCSSLPETEEVLAAVSDCLCAAFCVKAVQQLGHGSVQHLLQLSKAVPANSSKHIWSVHALVAGATSSAQCADAGAAMFGAADPAAVREAALTCLAAAPVLADLHSWSNWDKVFEPHLGDLVTFVAAASACGSAADGVLTLKLPTSSNGRCCKLLKLDKQADWKQLEQASSKGNVRQLVGSLLSQVVLSGGVAAAPLALMAQNVAAGLASFAANFAAIRAFDCQSVLKLLNLKGLM
eukprot:gene3173-3451_t